MARGSRRSLEETLKQHPGWILGGLLITGLSTGVVVAEWRRAPQLESLKEYEGLGTVTQVRDKFGGLEKEIARLKEEHSNKAGVDEKEIARLKEELAKRGGLSLPGLRADQVELVVCSEMERHCPGVVRACVLRYDPNETVDQVRLATTDRPIKFREVDEGPWVNDECKSRGTGWYMYASSCGSNRGTHFKGCQYVLSVQIRPARSPK